jgi:hypothetical protein
MFWQDQEEGRFFARSGGRELASTDEIWREGERGSYPMSRSSCACSLRRITLMVLTPLNLASVISWRPSVDPAALCSRYSPSGTFRVSRNPYAVTAKDRSGLLWP